MAEWDCLKKEQAALPIQILKTISAPLLGLLLLVFPSCLNPPRTQSVNY